MKQIWRLVYLEKNYINNCFGKEQKHVQVQKVWTETVCTENGIRLRVKKQIYTIIVHASIEGRNHFEKSKYKCKITVVYTVSEGNWRCIHLFDKTQYVNSTSKVVLVKFWKGTEFNTNCLSKHSGVFLMGPYY